MIIRLCHAVHQMSLLLEGQISCYRLSDRQVTHMEVNDCVQFWVVGSSFVGITAIDFCSHDSQLFSFLLRKGAPLAFAPLLV